MRGSRTVLEAWRASRTAGRRARNLRRGAPSSKVATPAVALPNTAARFTLPTLPQLPKLRAPRPSEWIAGGCVLGALIGAVVIAGHARHLSVAAGALGAVDGVYAADAFQATLPGAALTVPSRPPSPTPPPYAP